MAYAQFRSQGDQLVKALEARGHLFQRSAKAEIPISQLEGNPVTKDIFFRLADLPNLLNLAGDGPLSLAHARILYSSCILDTLYSVLSRIEWKTFCTQLDSIAVYGKGFILCGAALDCIFELLHAGWRVVAGADTARRETFARYCALAKHVLVVT